MGKVRKFTRSPRNKKLNDQTHIRQTINEIRTLTPRDSRWKYINMNPSAPSIKQLIKLHKTRPNNPTCSELDKCPRVQIFQTIQEKIHRLTSLPNAFNIKNTQDLIQNLNDTPILPCHSRTRTDEIWTHLIRVKTILAIIL